MFVYVFLIGMDPDVHALSINCAYHLKNTQSAFVAVLNVSSIERVHFIGSQCNLTCATRRPPTTETGQGSRNALH
jgi:hypothetical protein